MQLSQREHVVPSEATSMVVMPCRLGLHLRTASLIVLMAMRFESTIQLQCRQEVVDAKSIMSVLTLGVRCGEQVWVTAHGSDAQHAIVALADLFRDTHVLCPGES